MAIPGSTPFASFDVIDGSFVQDISPILAEALALDLNFLGSIQHDLGTPTYDPTHTWNDDVLNPISVVADGAYTNVAATVDVTDGTLVRIGDQLVCPSGEVMLVTLKAGNTLTVTRGYGGTSGVASVGTSDTLFLTPAAQEGSDIGSDATPNVSVLSNFTQIFPAHDILISRTQINRKMATDQLADFLGHQVTNRTLELKQGMTLGYLYGEKSADVGSDSSLRTLGGLRSFIRDEGGDLEPTFGQLTYDKLSAVNDKLVAKGQYVDTFLCGIDLIPAVSNFEQTNRRFLETDTLVGRTVEEIRMKQGNIVKVVSDGRLMPGDGFLYLGSDVKAVPFNNSAMVLYAASDFTDGKKRRVLGEWTLEVRRPHGMAYISGATV